MNEKLNKYFSKAPLSKEEKQELFQQLDKDKELQDEFIVQRNLLSLIGMQDKKGDSLYAYKNYREFKRKTYSLRLRKVALQAVKYAAVVILAVGSWAFYQDYGQNRWGETSDVNIEVPKGQRVHVLLPDGTKVWLNANSKLTYPAGFSKKNRKVFLEGEGFFDVTSDEKHPFWVNTSLMDVKVLGTKFNIKSYKEEEVALITLMEGKIELTTADKRNTLTMRPNEQAAISKTEGIALTNKLGAEFENSWAQGGFNYLNEPLENITRDLERRFDVRIFITDDDLRKETFTYRANEYATLDQILRHLKGTNELDYSQNNNQIHIVKH